MKHTETDTIGFRIRQARVKKGFSQKEFAKLLGIQPAWMSRLEHNSGKPSDELLMKIASLTCTDYCWLLQQKNFDDNVYNTITEVYSSFSDWYGMVMKQYKGSIKAPISFQEILPDNQTSRIIDLNNCPLNRWFLNFSTIFKEGHYSNLTWSQSFTRFIGHIILSPNECDTVKYTIVTENSYDYDAIPSTLKIPIGIVSVMLVRKEGAIVCAERYISTAPSRASQKYLEESFCFHGD